MLFDYEVLANSSGTALVRQRYTNWYQNWWHDLLPSQVVVAVLIVYTGLVTSWQDLTSWILPSAFLFYGVRSLVDQKLGLRWLPMYQHMP